MRTVEHAVRVRARADAIERLRPAVLLSSRWLRDDSTQAPRHSGTPSRALRGLRKLSILHGSPFRLVWASPTGLDSCLATAPVHPPPTPSPPPSSAPAKAGRQSHRPTAHGAAACFHSRRAAVTHPSSWTGAPYVSRGRARATPCTMATRDFSRSSPVCIRPRTPKRWRRWWH